jgi:hypothetical protein
MAEPAYTKIAFELKQDEYGYPPVTVETLWASETNDGFYCLDNIPFYAHGVSPGDVIRTKEGVEPPTFDEVIRKSLNSVFRIYVSVESDVPEAREAFKEIGCESELSDIPKLFAIEIPASQSFDEVGKLMTIGSDAGRWEYEEACMQHPLGVL